MKTDQKCYKCKKPMVMTPCCLNCGIIPITEASDTAQREELAALPALVGALRGTADMLRESAKMHRIHGDTGHAETCELHANAARQALTAATK